MGEELLAVSRWRGEFLAWLQGLKVGDEAWVLVSHGEFPLYSKGEVSRVLKTRVEVTFDPGGRREVFHRKGDDAGRWVYQGPDAVLSIAPRSRAIASERNCILAARMGSVDLLQAVAQRLTRQQVKDLTAQALGLDFNNRYGEDF